MVFFRLPVETFVFDDILIVLFSNLGAGPAGAAAAAAATGTEEAVIAGIDEGIGTLGLFVISLLEDKYGTCVFGSN